jgi:hypothetical protein
VVVALPLHDLGVQEGGRLSRPEAFTAVGSYLTGPIDVMDAVALSR